MEHADPRARPNPRGVPDRGLHRVLLSPGESADADEEGVLGELAACAAGAAGDHVAKVAEAAEVADEGEGEFGALLRAAGDRSHHLWPAGRRRAAEVTR